MRTRDILSGVLMLAAGAAACSDAFGALNPGIGRGARIG